LEIRWRGRGNQYDGSQAFEIRVKITLIRFDSRG
jgi:hypothetical protein